MPSQLNVVDAAARIAGGDRLFLQQVGAFDDACRRRGVRLSFESDMTLFRSTFLGLGDPRAHAQVLKALASPVDRDVQIAQAYLRHRPLADPAELREVVAGIARMPASEAKVRALDALSRHYISDEEILDELARSFASSRSVGVQRAIAGVLVRSDYRKPGLATVLREHRLDKAGSGGLIDVLIGQLPAS